MLCCTRLLEFVRHAIDLLIQDLKIPDQGQQLYLFFSSLASSCGNQGAHYTTIQTLLLSISHADPGEQESKHQNKQGEKKDVQSHDTTGMDINDKANLHSHLGKRKIDLKNKTIIIHKRSEETSQKVGVLANKQAWTL